MIESVAIRNYKRFGLAQFSLRRLTILTGRNGTGKSSLIQAILLVRAAAVARGGEVPINGTMGLELGEAAELLNTTSSEDSFSIEVAGGDKVCEVTFGVEEERAFYLRIRELRGEPPEPLLSSAAAFTYLCAERLGPREVNAASSVGPDQLGVGPQGEYTAYLLAQCDRVEVGPQVRHPLTMEMGSVVTLRRQTEYWLSDLIGPVEINATLIQGAAIATLRYKYPGVKTDWLRPSNFGFGYTYVLPIVVAGLLSRPGSTLVVENPEAHLHPEAQSKLGAFLARAASGGAQVLVETHSDHLLNGMRKAVAMGVCSPNDVGLYFFDRRFGDDAEAVRVSDNGTLSDWPRGFFDQIEIDLADLARRQR